MAHFENSAPVHQQVAHQIIHGDIYHFVDHNAPVKRQNSDLLALNIRDHISSTLQSNYEDVAFSAADDPYEGTCSWLLSHRIYLQWSAATNPEFLWLCGPPGCGKTMVARFALQHWRKVWTESHNVVYFFFSGQIEKASSPVNFLSALINQILQQYPVTKLLLQELPALKALQSVAMLTSSEEGLWNTLDQVLKALQFLTTTNPQKPLLCVIDAIEECTDSPSRNFYRRLNKDLCASQFPVRVLITCRQDYLERSYGTQLHQNIIHLDEENSYDIQDYVASHLRLWSPSSADSEVVKRLELTITNMANGIFLWAALVVEGLLQRGSRLQTVLNTINSFPRGRDDKLRKLYEEILKQASNNLQDEYLISDIKSILRTVILSTRPLGLNELAECLEVETKEDRRLDLAHDIKNTCRGLLKIEGGLVKPFHITLAAYIGNAAECLPQFYIDPDEGHAQLAETCLSYAIDPITFLRSAEPDDIMVALDEHAFLEYAASQWPYHVKRTTSRRQSIEQLIQDLLGTEQNFQKWYSMILSFESVLRQQLHLFRMTSGESLDLSAMQPSPAHILSLIGFNRSLFTALFQSDDLDKFSIKALGPENKDDQGRTPAHWAASYGTLGSTAEPAQWMTLLITHSVKLDSMFDEPEVLAYILSIFPESAHIQDTTGRTPLHLACASGDSSKVRVLLKVQPDINIRDLSGYTALHHCCGPMGYDTAKMLVTNNADPDVHGEDGNTALHIAALHGQERTVKLLIDKKVDVNAQNSTGMSPLHSVVVYGKNYAQALIANMVSHQLLDGQSDDPMDWLTSFFESFAAREMTIKRLIAAGADVEQKTAFGETALFIAAFGGHLQFVKLLLSAKAQINETNAYGWTSLYGAAFTGQEPIVQVLINAGADATLGDMEGTTPLHIAARLGHTSTVKSLMKTGIDVNTVNLSGYTCLHQAVMTDLDVLKFVASATHKTDSGGTPYLTALEDRELSVRLRAHEEIVKLLLDAGVNIKAAAQDGATPLHVAAAHGHVPLLAMLIERGVDINATNLKGGHPIDAASIMGNDECVELLITHGAEVVAESNNGDDGFSALHLASMMGHGSTVKILLRAGIAADVVTKDGSTPIHLVVDNDKSEYVTSSSMESNEGDHTKADGTTLTLYMAQKNRSWEEIEEDRLHCLELLISNGANLDLADAGGFTALHKASMRGRDSMLEMLLKNGANTEIRSQTGATALWCALITGKHAAVEMLIKHGADIEALNDNGYPPLLCAILFENFEIAKLLIESGANLNGVFDDGQTCLMLAAGTGYVDVVEALLRHGADAGAINKDGDSALNFAVEGGHTTVCKLLLEQKVDVNTQGSDGTPLTMAAGNGYLELVEALLDNGADISLRKDDDTWSPLQTAANNNHVEVVKFLLEKGASVLTADGSGWTSLHLAISKGHVMVVSKLLEHGVDIHVATNNGCTPLYLAASNNHVDLTQLLIERGADSSTKAEGGWTPLHAAVSNGHTMIVKELLDHGADPNLGTDTGRTPLYSAVCNDHVELFRLLVEKGAHINTQTDQGWTPLHSAAENGHAVIAKELLKNGADTSVTNGDGRTALHQAARVKATETLSALLESKPDLNALDKWNWTPLHITADTGNADATRLLLEAGADPNIRGHRGTMPVHSAARSGNLELVQLILTHKGLLQSKNDDKDTVLHIASREGHPDLCKWLLENNMEINAVDGYGCTPLIEALRANHKVVAQQLLDSNADVSIADLSGYTALHYAAMNDQLEMVKSLESRGASLDATARNGSTLLHVAVKTKDCAVLKFLLQERQQNPNVFGSSRISPLHNAVYAFSLPAAKILVEAGADVRHIDCYGRSCLEWAKDYPAMRTILSKDSTEQADPSAQQSRHVVLTALRELLETQDSGNDIPWHVIGHCFLFISDEENARMAFRQQITSGVEVEDLTHSVTCNMCPPDKNVLGRRYVCRECPDVDLCEKCKNAYMKDWCMIGCRDHEFLAVPDVEPINGNTKDTSAVKESRQECLKRMRDEVSSKMNQV